MIYNIDEKYYKEDYSQKELDMINNIFGLFTKNIYFSMYCDVTVEEDDKFINFAGISGSGKTVIKNALKTQVQDQGIHVLDFDDIDNFEQYHDITILELLDIKSEEDEILKIIGGFGLFEMRILTSKIKDLSNGQRTRLKYIYLINQLQDDVESYIFIDEFLTFVDDLSAISFAMTIKKYLQNKNAKLFTFGVNLNLVGQFEDISYILGNSTINTIVKNNKIIYTVEQEVCRPDIKINEELTEEVTELDEW